MKKITDERLIFRNLQHIKIIYIVQSIGILCILGYELFQGGLEGMRKNPLWLLFIVTSVVYAYLSISTSVENEKALQNPKKSFVVSIIVLIAIATAVAYLTIAKNFGWTNGVVIGVILFICGFIPFYYVYRLRERQIKDLNDDQP
ncbi:hypothetical protein ACN9MH_15650 [Paenibacillus silvae]|uniref:hypothetical protein n=1 Tax=Paenibacillus silvae TaxID=1325358 RepID=UPI003CFB8EC7